MMSTPHRWLSRACCAATFSLLLGALPLRSAPQLVPGVYGYGADRAINSAGFGSGANIYEVTSLADTNTQGTLRHAIQETTRPRVVVFKVSGIIQLQNSLELDVGNITIAGQTAPSPGIALHGATLNVNTSNVLVQHLRIRPGDSWSGPATRTRDAVGVSENNDVIGNVVFDHCTFGWSLDEVAGIWYAWDNVMFNRCIFAEPLNHSIHLDEDTMRGDVPVQADDPDSADITFTTSPGGLTTASVSSGVAIGGTYHRVDTSADGHYITYRIPIIPAGSNRLDRHITIVGITGTDRGIYKVDVWDSNGVHRVNSASTGETVDLYASSATQHTYTTQKHVTTGFTLAGGVNWLDVRLTVADKHGSSTGRKLAIDQLSVTDGHAVGILFSSGANHTNSNYVGAGKASMTGSIIAHVLSRGPWSAAQEFYFGNNVVYNWRSQALHFGHSSFQTVNRDEIDAAVVGNTFIEGRDFLQNKWAVSDSSTMSGSRLYVPTAENAYDYGDHPRAMVGTFPSGTLVGTDYTDKTHGLSGVVARPPATAFAEAMLLAGARPNDRDAFENRIVSEIIAAPSVAQLANRPGAIKNSVAEAGGWPTYASNSATWTLPVNPNLDDGAAGYPAGNGYTNIEEWLHRMSAQLEADTGGTISDNFSDNNADGWTSDGGTWSVSSGVYRQTDNSVGANRSVLSGTHWTDQTIEADVTFTSVSGSDRFFGVVARYANPDNYYYFILRTSGVADLKKLVGGSPAAFSPAVTAVPYTVQANTTYRLRLVVEGTNLRAYINNVLVLQASDSTHAVGKVGLLTHFTAVNFDNIVARDSGTDPVPGAFSLASPANGATGVATTPTLDWGDATGATSYTLQIDDNSAFSSPSIQSGIANSTVNVSPALAQGTQYYWKISAVNSGGSTDATNNPFSFTTTLPAPSGLGATATSISQINLSWTDNSANEDGFKIERKKGAGGTYAQIATVGANVTSYSNTSLGAGTQYYYRVRAYRGAVNSSFSSEANATTTEVTSGRRAHWKLDENTGTSAADSSGNSNTGTLANGANWVAGKIGSAVNFDAVDNVINAGSGSTLDNLAAVTITAWIKANSVGEGGSPGRILHKGTGTNPAAGWQFVTQGSNAIGFTVDYSTTDVNRVAAANAITLGTWHHVAVTWTGSATATNIKLYVDGVEVSYATTTNGSGSRVGDGSSSVFIGNNSTGERTFDGAIDDVRVYNRVITTAELQAIHRAGL